MQLLPNDDYTKAFMTKIATGQASPAEQAAFDSHVHEARSLPSIQNLLQRPTFTPLSVHNQLVWPTTTAQAPCPHPVPPTQVPCPGMQYPVPYYMDVEAQKKRRAIMESNEADMADMNRRRLIMIEKEQTQMHYGTPDSTWERCRTRLLDEDPMEWPLTVPMGRHTEFEKLWTSFLAEQKLQRRKSKGLAATLAANQENRAKLFKKATRENAAKYTKPFCNFLTENPTVFHCIDAMKDELKDAGFTELSERDSWAVKPSGSYFVERNGSSLIAFTVGAKYQPGNGAAILAGHVDALTAKLKPISQVTNKAGK